MKTITFEDEKYKLISRKEDMIIFKKINEFKQYDLHKLASEYAMLTDELESEEERASNHQRRIDEFRYCGYNEEDEDFHGMCVYQNELDNNVERIENKQSKILEEIEKRLNNDSTEIMLFLNEYGIDY